MTKQQTFDKATDKAIEIFYYKHAQGVQIGIMDIGKLYNDARQAFKEGKSLEQAVIDGIAKYCKPA